MVFQLKSGPRANRTPFKGKNRKSFKDDGGLDESYVQMKKTPKGKHSLRTPDEKLVVFHISGNTPGNKTAKASDVITPNSVNANKQFTPERKGKTMIKEFQGTSFNLSNKNGILKDEELNSEDDDDDNDFDHDLGGDKEDEDDDQETEEKDDGKEKTKGVTINENSSKKNVKISPKNKAEKIKIPAKISEKVTKHKNKTSVKNLKNEGGETMCNLKDDLVQENESKLLVKSPVVAENETKSKFTAAQRQEILANYMESKREREMRRLFIRSLPHDITPEDIKAWSSDILEVVLLYGYINSSRRCGFICFASEKKAEENYALLQGKKVRGCQIEVDYVGEKSKDRKRKDFESGATINLKKLFVGGLAADVTIDKVAKIFPVAFQITISQTERANRSAEVCYSSAELAAAEFETGKYAEIDGKLIQVDYSSANKSYEDKSKRNLRTLLIGCLPCDITPEDIGAWSSDICRVVLRDPSNSQRKRRAFIYFASEKKAEENYALLQGKTVRGCQIEVDYVGGKCKQRKRKNNESGASNGKALFVSGFAADFTVAKVAKIFSKANNISIVKNEIARVGYASAELAAAEYEAGKNAKIDGKLIQVQYWDNKKRVRPFKMPFAKRFKSEKDKFR